MLYRFNQWNDIFWYQSIWVYRFGFTTIIYIYIYYCGGQLIPCVQAALEEARPNIQSHMYNLRKKGPGPISNPRIREYPRTTSKRRDDDTLRGEVKSACEEFDRVRGRQQPRNFCPRCLVNLSVTQSNASNKPYNKMNGKISNKG